MYYKKGVIKLFKCRICGKKTQKPDSLCVPCIIYLRKGGIVYDTSKLRGQAQQYTISGNPICAICGRESELLKSHLRQAHDITTEDYIKDYLGGKKPKRLAKLGGIERTYDEDTRSRFREHMNNIRVKSKYVKIGEERKKQRKKEQAIAESNAKNDKK